MILLSHIQVDSNTIKSAFIHLPGNKRRLYLSVTLLFLDHAAHVVLYHVLFLKWNLQLKSAGTPFEKEWHNVVHEAYIKSAWFNVQSCLSGICEKRPLKRERRGEGRAQGCFTLPTLYFILFAVLLLQLHLWPALQ